MYENLTAIIHHPLLPQMLFSLFQTSTYLHIKTFLSYKQYICVKMTTIWLFNKLLQTFMYNKLHRAHNV